MNFKSSKQSTSDPLDLITGYPSIHELIIKSIYDCVKNENSLEIIDCFHIFIGEIAFLGFSVFFEAAYDSACYLI